MVGRSGSSTRGDGASDKEAPYSQIVRWLSESDVALTSPPDLVEA